MAPMPLDRSRPRGIPVARLCKHLFVSGTPGSGKTTAILGLLIQLVRRGIPFIVFEPAKSEYRLLKCLKDHAEAAVRRLARELQVYTPGLETLSPLRVNPLAIPEGARQHERIENRLNCFKGAMPMSGPLPAVLGEAMELAAERASRGGPPSRMADLYEACHEVLAAKGYSADVASDIRAALDVRLGVLTRRAIGRVFQCGEDVPPAEQLEGGFSVIELAALPPEQASLLTLFLLTAVRERVSAAPASDRKVKLVLVLEEAHALIGRNTDAAPSEENADPKAFASELICRMLAELRALGVALVIVDQHPSAVAAQVIKSTGSSLAFRQVERKDREELGGAMLLGPAELEELARLRPGEAYFFTEGYFGPRRIRTPNLHAELGLPPPPVGGGIIPFLQDDGWFAEARAARVAAEMSQLKRDMDQFDAMRLGIVKQAAQMAARRVQVLKGPAPDRARRLAELGRRARALRNRLNGAVRAFRRDVYQPLMEHNEREPIADVGIQALRDQLVNRFGSVIEPDARSCIEMLGRLTRSCDPLQLAMKGD
ncbi:MAG TPA: hypothetical protein VM285_16935 [Polyangia bacterium]|nr:hypothetical protein [Polyangia bacterium]